MVKLKYNNSNKMYGESIQVFPCYGWSFFVSEVNTIIFSKNKLQKRKAINDVSFVDSELCVFTMHVIFKCMLCLLCRLLLFNLYYHLYNKVDFQAMTILVMWHTLGTKWKSVWPRRIKKGNKHNVFHRNITGAILQSYYQYY